MARLSVAVRFAGAAVALSCLCVLASASVLDDDHIEPHVNAGLPFDIPEEMMNELYEHIDEFLGVLREGPGEDELEALMNMKVDKELEALIALQHYFENPETSVVAEEILQKCEADMDNCPLLQHLSEPNATVAEGDENRRKLAQAKYSLGNPNKLFLNTVPLPAGYGPVSAFQFYRDQYCSPPRVNPAEFDFVSEYAFTGTTYAFVIAGGSIEWDPKTQQLTVNKPQVAYSKVPASVDKSGYSTSKGSASEKSCSFEADLQFKGKVPGYSEVKGIEYQYLKPNTETVFFLDAFKPATWPSLKAWWSGLWEEPVPNQAIIDPQLLQAPLTLINPILPSLTIT